VRDERSAWRAPVVDEARAIGKPGLVKLSCAETDDDEKQAKAEAPYLSQG
jgi:hypothetical protein